MPEQRSLRVRFLGMPATVSPRVVLNIEPLVRCPAATPIAEVDRGVGVRCSIEHSNVTAVGHGHALWGFCCGDYTACSTWQAEKRAIWENRANQHSADMLEGAN